MKTYKKLLSLFFSIGLVFVSAYLSGTFAMVDGRYYHNLVKPELIPPNIVFTIAWSIIYVTFIVFLATTIFKKEKRKYSLFLGLILILNALFCLLFFTLELPLVGFFVLILQLILLLFLANYFIDTTKYLWLLLIPTILWYIFATYLQYIIVILN